MTEQAAPRATVAGPATALAFGPAIGTWAIAWVGGALVAAPVLTVLFGARLGDDLTIPQLATAQTATWTVMAAALVVASRQFGTGDVISDYVARFRPLDLVGVPLGVAMQLALVPLLYLPLRGLWPSTFSVEQVEESARELADRAGGWLTVLLVVIVVVGAPIVEEFMYRALLQRSVSTVVGTAFGLVSTSAWFALIHLTPVLYPGLFLSGLVFGGCVVATGRIGPAIVTHAAFNATGLVIVLQSGG